MSFESLAPVQSIVPTRSVARPRAADWSAVAGWPSWLRLWLPVIVALLVGAAFQGSRGLMETSETRYAECAREMVATGNWLEPSLGFQPHWTKPPVAYWCIAVGLELFGVNAWGVRLPGVLALMLATWAVTLAGRRIWGETAGLAAGLAFGVGLFPLAGAYTVTTDIFLTAAAAWAAVAFLFAATEADPVRRRRFVVAMWAAWGLGFMIKGPPALLPMLAFIPWNLAQPRNRRVPLGDWRGLLAFVAVASPWYVAMWVRHPDLLEYYVGTEIVARVASDLGHNRAWYKAFREFGPVLVLALGVPGLWALKLSLGKGGWGGAARWRELWKSCDLRLLMVGWVVVPLVVFTLARSKLPFYVLPLTVPLALLAGKVLAARADWVALRRILVGTVLFLVVSKAVVAHVPDRKDMAALSQEIRAELDQMPLGARIVLWDEPVNHGISFYLQSPTREALCERIAEGEKGKFESWTVAEFRQHLSEGGYPRGALLVVGARQRAAFELALPQLPVVTEKRGRFWHLLRLGAEIPAAGARLVGD